MFEVSGAASAEACICAVLLLCLLPAGELVGAVCGGCFHGTIAYAGERACTTQYSHTVFVEASTKACCCQGCCQLLGWYASVPGHCLMALPKSWQDTQENNP